MRKYSWFAMVAALLAADGGMARIAVAVPVETENAPSVADAPSDLMRQAQAAIVKLRNNDVEGASASLNAITADPKFGQETPNFRYVVFYLLALSEMQQQKLDKAYQHLTLAATAFPVARDYEYWAAYCETALRLHKDDVAAEALASLAKDFPERLNDLNYRFINTVVDRTKSIKDGGTHRQLLLEALWAAKYDTNNGFVKTEDYWFSLFKIYVDRADEAKARMIASSFVESSTILRLQIDKRYLAYAPAGPDAFQKALDANLARDQQKMIDHPDSLEDVNLVVDHLLTSGKPDAALALIDTAMAKADQAPKDRPAYKDSDEQLNWTLDYRSRVLAKLGRWDEVEAVQTRAMDVALKAGDDMVSQKINLGGLYYDLGRAQAALDEVKDIAVNQTSPYGAMAAEEVRACAYAELGDKPNLATSLRYMQAHADEGYRPLQSALLCAGDEDALAKLYITRLENPDTRDDVLIDAQVYLPETYATPHGKLMNAERATVFARPDVHAAVMKYGVVLSYPIYPFFS